EPQPFSGRKSLLCHASGETQAKKPEKEGFFGTFPPFGAAARAARADRTDQLTDRTDRTDQADLADPSSTKNLPPPSSLQTTNQPSPSKKICVNLRNLRIEKNLPPPSSPQTTNQPSP
ncbi:MAG: hypothetical protein ACOX9E_10800, partial [Lentisphaeria bacterium]